MGSASILVFAAAMFINIVVVYKKLKQGNTANAVIDLIVLVALSYTFGGTTSGMAIATIASALFSIYLFIDPVDKDFLKKFNL